MRVATEQDCVARPVSRAQRANHQSESAPVPDLDDLIVFAASAELVVNMGVATYVHVQPEVPANAYPWR